jgi:hypothetical protein
MPDPGAFYGGHGFRRGIGQNGGGYVERPEQPYLDFANEVIDGFVHHVGRWSFVFLVGAVVLGGGAAIYFATKD